MKIISMRLRNYKILKLVIDYLIVLLLIIDCNTVYRHILGYPIVPRIWSYLIILMALRVFINYNTGIKLYSFKILLLMLYNALVMALVYVPQSQILMFTMLYMLFFPLALLSCIEDIINNKVYYMIYIFENIIIVLAVFSLIFWLAGSLFNIIAYNIELPVTWNNGELYRGYFGLVFQFKDQYEVIPYINIKIFRNIGIFTESPMYNVVLVIALYVELFLKHNSKKIIMALLVVTIISTFGTLGILLMLGGFYLKIMLGLSTKRKRVVGVFLSTILILSVLILVINKKLNATGSYNIHLDDYIAGFKAWKTSPVLGTGFNNYDVIRSFMNPNRDGNLGTSNSFTDVMAQGGIMCLSIYMIPFISLFKKYKSNFKIVCWSLAPFILFIVTIYHNTFLLIFLLAFCMANSWSNKL